MEFSKKTFQVLDALHTQEISTQRQLAEHSGISLGQVNYILKSLLEKGLVKIGNFRNNPHKIGYMYLLTPKGIEAKSRLAVDFVIAKLKEYDTLRARLAEQLALIENTGRQRILFVGPSMVGDFIGSIIKEGHFKLGLVAHLSDWNKLKEVDEGSFDMALLFDGSPANKRKISEATGLPPEKLTTLW